jgi:YidC/Oxa1 family membrane protein insertase
MTRCVRLWASLGVLAVVGGCMSQSPPSNAGIDDVGEDIRATAATPGGEALALAGDFAARAARIDDEKGDREEAAQLHFRAGCLYERLRKARLAADEYAAAAKAGAGRAYQAKGEVAWLARDDYGPGARKLAISRYSVGGRYAPTRLWGKDENPPTVWLIPTERKDWPSALIPQDQANVTPRRAPLRESCFERLDTLYRGEFAYRFMQWAIGIAGHIWPSQRWALAIILIAVAAKLLLTPLTSAQFRSMKAMQRIQPLMKELQEKHKNDRQAMAQAQMRLFKEHRVNPLGGCLPLLIQMPILIFIYRAVDMYKYQFSGHGLLWVASLADPDMPLLILYAASMYLSMRLTTAPSMDPQQQQMQTMMAMMMPVMFLLLFRSLPSAFILYWFVLNVLSTAHQFYILRQPVEAPVAPGT